VTYSLGIDLGTTFSAAAISRDGRAEIVTLGSRMAAIPSIVYLGQDGRVIVGEAALRRAVVEPSRVAREFKRRIGDAVPIMVGGAPYSADALTARLLSAIYEEVTRREGGHPDHVTVTHPANWGPFKTELLRQAIRLAEIDQYAPTSLLPEPEAAAIFYAATERLPSGRVVAVYDLGGGTFDAAVLRKTDHGFEFLGPPEGIERLGGIDFDAAVLHYVATALDGLLGRLDPSAPAVTSAGIQLSRDSTDAKEALSTDTEVTIPVALPGRHTEIRLTRSEFEAMVRPSLLSSVEALERGLRAADVAPADLVAVLLVGGSSRIPLVSQVVGERLGVTVAVDAHPKHSVALGAAAAAAQRAAATKVASGGEAVAPSPTPRRDTGDRSGSSKKFLLVGGLAGVLALAAGVFALSRGGGDGGGEATRTTAVVIENTSTTGSTTTTTSAAASDSFALFETDRGGSLRSIWAANIDGSRARRVIETSGADGHPTLSSNGRRLAYLHTDTPDDDDSWQLVVSAPDGSGANVLAEGVGRYFRPAWSPDDTTLVMPLNVGGQVDLWRIDVATGDRQQITDTPEPDLDPDWSPDGQQLVYRSDVHGGDPEVFVANIDGSNPVRLTQHPGYDSDPKWSLDGSLILFTTDVGDGNEEICTRARDGSNVVNLTNNPAKDHDGVWLRGGDGIVFTSERDAGDVEVYAMAADGSNQRRVTDNPGYDGVPDGV